ncbi:MAG: hypothetical protein GYB68_09770, partial [Chloroflexi bacterium]|nr:hypothetical protein [Chloroflexota bacterium]
MKSKFKSSLEVFQEFHKRTTEKLPRESEAFGLQVDSQTLAKMTFRYSFSVSAMTRISHVIENTVRRSPRVADLHVSFQYVSRVADQYGRYVEVAENARALILYAVKDAPLPDLANLTFVDTEGTTLVDYWYLVAYGPGISMTLLAQEIPGRSKRSRMYEGFYTFEPAIAFDVAQIMHDIFPTQVPKPTRPDA